MTRALKANWIGIVCVFFVLVNAVLTAHEIYWFNLLPAVLLVVWAMVASLERLLLFIAFATPLSINLEELELGGIGVSLPTEPLMVGVMLLFLLKLAMERGVVAPRVWRHPITVLIIAQLVWMAVTIVPSSMPVVSLKAFTAQLWFITTMYFVATRLFENPRSMHGFMWAFLGGLAIVVLYTLIHHAQYDFAHDPGHWVMSPFFKDHTSYGAVIAFFLPFVVAAVGMPGYTRTRKGAAALLLLLLLAGLVFSYTRAAWLSLLGALGLFVVMRLRIPVWVLALLLVTGGGLYWANQEQITIALERNREESSDDLGEHVRSISNISSDASNLERINRWNSALRMWKERPVFGWGPGTYMFQYAPSGFVGPYHHQYQFRCTGQRAQRVSGPFVGARSAGDAAHAGTCGGHRPGGDALVRTHAGRCRSQVIGRRVPGADDLLPAWGAEQFPGHRQGGRPLLGVHGHDRLAGPEVSASREACPGRGRRYYWNRQVSSAMSSR